MPNEIRDYVKGLYGKAPVAIDSEINQKIIGDQEVLAVRTADLIEPQMTTLRDEIKQYAKSEEDVLSCALFEQQGKDFLGRREDRFYDVPL